MNKINWKKDNFIVGQKVFLIRHSMFVNENTESHGEVIYVGTKRLAVKIGEKRTIVFNGQNYSKDGCAMFGHYYSVYKSKDEYLSILKARKEKAALINSAENVLENMTNDELRELIEKYKTKEV